METKIVWHLTKDELPEVRTFIAGKNKQGNDIVMKYDDRCLVVFEGKVMISRYLSQKDKPRWEGFTKQQAPEYWIKLNEIEMEKNNG